MRKLLMLLTLAILVTGLVQAQPTVTPQFANLIAGETVSAAVSAVSTDTVLLVKYIGTDTSATLEVAAGGDILFVESAAADVSVICPSGGTGGTIDVSNAACDTLGEVVDIINGDVNWAAVILDGLRADSSDNTLITRAASAADIHTPEGAGLLNDGTVSFFMTRALTEKRNMTFYIGGSNQLLPNPFRGERTVDYQFSATTTYASGTSTMEWISSDGNYRLGSETTTTIWSEAGGATTVLKTVNFQPFGIFGKKDEKLLVRVNNSAALTAATGNAYGSEYQMLR